MIFEVLITLLLVSFFRHAGLWKGFKWNGYLKEIEPFLGLGIANDFVLDILDYFSTNTWNMPTSRLD